MPGDVAVPPAYVAAGRLHCALTVPDIATVSGEVLAVAVERGAGPADGAAAVRAGIYLRQCVYRRQIAYLVKIFRPVKFSLWTGWPRTVFIIKIPPHLFNCSAVDWGRIYSISPYPDELDGLGRELGDRQLAGVVVECRRPFGSAKVAHPDVFLPRKPRD